MIFDVAVVGSGPAGMAAVIQLCRQGQSVVLFEARQPGGLLHNAHRVDNYPGFPAGISGSELVELMWRQLKGHNHSYIQEEVSSMQWDGNIFQLSTKNKKVEAGRVFIASGTSSNPPQDILIDRNANNCVTARSPTCSI